jgi:SMI1-KNR4 cell-wall
MIFAPDLMKILEECKPLGHKKMKNGTLLIGLNTEIRNDYWLHRLFTPLTNDSIISIEKESNLTFPSVYKTFLREYNGVFLFGGYFYIYGKSFLEKGMSREEQLYQPYDLIEENEDPPLNIPDHLFYFGGSPNAIYVLDNNENVMKLNRKSGKLIGKWETFKDCLTSEITKLHTENKYFK